MENTLYDDGFFKVTSTKVSVDDGEKYNKTILMEEISSTSIYSEDIFPHKLLIFLFVAAGIWNYVEEFMSTKIYLILAIIVYVLIYIRLNEKMWNHTLCVASTGFNEISITFKKCKREPVMEIKKMIDEASAKRKEQLSK